MPPSILIALLLAVVAFAAPIDRGGHAEPAHDHGGEALAVIGMAGGEPVTRVSELPTFGAFVCIHGHEADWQDDLAPYWGGLQMDLDFMRAYGLDMIRRHHGGLANVWTPAEQILVAHRAWLKRGFGPWPNTRLPCRV